MENKSGHTAGPWPITQAGDGKRWIIGAGLVEGPNGYEVAEVYADDCPYIVSYANSRLIASAPELLEALETLPDRFEEATNNPCTCATDENSCPFCGAWEIVVRDVRMLVAKARGSL